MPQLKTILQAAAELGLEQLALYGRYQVGLRSGHYRRRTPARLNNTGCVDPSCILRTDLLPLPEPYQLKQLVPLDILLTEADEIVAGMVRLFGGNPVPLALSTAGPLKHWSEIQDDRTDVKPTWEAGRFGWAITLARAYHVSNNEDYAQAFWRYTLDFITANPPNLGQYWVSAQEVALRLMSLVFAIQVFARSSHTTPERMTCLSQSLVEHANRIPPTLVYARAQNNNHLVSEATGLYTAAAVLPSHPRAMQWKKLGRKWLIDAFQKQIAADGTYIQQSTNYHRLMLQAALWAFTIQHNAFPNEPFPDATLQRLSDASRWLYKLLDPVSGRTPNLGPNDGAYILPLCSCPQHDYRPVVNAAGMAFMRRRLVPAGPWDEMSVWFGLEKEALLSKQPGENGEPKGCAPHTLHHKDAWAYFRAVQFHARPGHADQLHLDMWWRGLNIAQDAGTYLYTAAPPWDNALAHTAVHNTAMVDNQEQMRRAGRFLYLEWAQASAPVYEHAADGSWQRLTAQHNGYRRKGILHKREVTVNEQEGWLISDIVSGQPADKEVHQVRVHWLLPDWEYEIETGRNPGEATVLLFSPYVKIPLKVRWMEAQTQLRERDYTWVLARAGQLVAGAGPVQPTWGWTSVTYGDKIPALSFYVTVSARLPIHITSQWGLP
jgi:hypothetical protein